jgi:hypothetical protein
VVADAALRRAARDVVRDAEALEGRDGAVVHPRRDGDGHGLLALREDADQVWVDVERLTDATELLLSDLKGVLTKVRDRGVYG